MSGLVRKYFGAYFKSHVISLFPSIACWVETVNNIIPRVQTNFAACVISNRIKQQGKDCV